MTGKPKAEFQSSTNLDSLVRQQQMSLNRHCSLPILAASFCLFSLSVAAQADTVVVTNPARVAVPGGQDVKAHAGGCQIAHYLSEDVLKELGASVDRMQRRPPVLMFVFSTCRVAETSCCTACACA